MNETQAMAEIKRLAAGGQVRVTPHAKQRMRERSITPADVTNAFATATKATADGQYRYRVTGGVDCDHDDLSAIVTIEADLIVITLF